MLKERNPGIIDDLSDDQLTRYGEICQSKESVVRNDCDMVSIPRACASGVPCCR